MKKYLPWAAIVALLIGLALLPGPKAGAAAPVASITSTSAVVGGTWTVTYTITNNDTVTVSFAILYPPTPAGGTVSGFPASIAAGQSASFTDSGLPCSTTSYAIDILTANDLTGYVDLPGGGTLPGSCPTPTTTTTVPAPPSPAPPAPSVGLPPDGPVPVVTPPMAPLAFTGAPILPEVGVALALIALGLLLVRRSVRHA